MDAPPFFFIKNSTLKNNSTSMRKAFNFYRSYYEVLKELPEGDRYPYLLAILKRQFDGIEPSDLSGMALFAYKSQQHSIDAQVKGYESKTGTTVGGIEGGSAQEKEKEKEKEKGQYDRYTIDDCIDYHELIKYFNDRTGRNETHVSSSVKGNIKQRLYEMVCSGKTIDEAKLSIGVAIYNASFDKWLKDNNILTLFWITKEDNFYKWLDTPPKQTRKAPASV